MSETKMQIAIAELVPYELAALAGKVRLLIKMAQEGNTKPIKVLKVGEHWVVADGTNRVMAAKAMGQKAVEAVEVFRQEHEMTPYRTALTDALAKGWKGFENFPIAESEETAVRRKVAQPPPMPSRGGRPAPRPAFGGPPPRGAPAGLSQSDVLYIVNGCIQRERVRMATVLRDRKWIILKADNTVDISASIGRLAVAIASEAAPATEVLPGAARH